MLYSSRLFGGLVLLVGLAGCGGRGASEPAGGAEAARQYFVSPAIANDSSLGVMTVNLWHKDRPSELKIVADELRTNPKGLPDFILCQEVVFNRDGELEDTAQVLAAELGYHSQGTKRTSDREGVAIISRYPFTFYDHRHLESQTSRLLLGFRRVSVMGEFQVPGVGLVRVANVHFTNWGFEKHVRMKQLRETLSWVAQRNRQMPAAVTFLGGDFNAEPDSDEIALVRDNRANGGLTFRDYNNPAIPSKGPPGNPKKRIDYIFVASAAALAFDGEQVLWKNGLARGGDRFYLSDHLPVVHFYSYPTGLSQVE